MYYFIKILFRINIYIIFFKYLGNLLFKYYKFSYVFGDPWSIIRRSAVPNSGFKLFWG